MPLRLFTGYGPLENASEAKVVEFYSRFDEEIKNAIAYGTEIIIELDFNAKLGKEIIPNDPHPQSANGKLLEKVINDNDLIVADKFTIGGNLLLNPISNSYSGNTAYSFIKFSEKDGSEFSNIEVSNTNLGRLNQVIAYDEKSINLKLLNPSYALLGKSKKSLVIGGYLDTFSANATDKLQTILDEINYVASDEIASDKIGDLVLSNAYEPFIERLEMYTPNQKQGIFINES